HRNARPNEHPRASTGHTSLDHAPTLPSNTSPDINNPPQQRFHHPESHRIIPCRTALLRTRCGPQIPEPRAASGQYHTRTQP
ncbi:MAG: hypothetical protein L6R35_007435, partial [Caloplaca aegaea]